MRFGYFPRFDPAPMAPASSQTIQNLFNGLAAIFCIESARSDTLAELPWGMDIHADSRGILLHKPR
jgi:hypothetical protein